MSNSRKVISNGQKASRPEPVGQGRYALYTTSKGEGVLSYRPDGCEEDYHQLIPAILWGILLKGMRGEEVDANPITLIKAMMGK